MNNSINIIFYSRACPTCQNLLNVLQNENLLGNFKLFCVDERLNEVPPQIQVVPTMIVSSVNKPLVAQEIFEWIQKIKFIRQKNIMDMNRKIIQQNLIQLAENKSGPIPFRNSEMGSISDPFAYKDIDNPMPQSFFNVGEEEKNGIFTAPEQKPISKNQQEQMISAIETMRSEQDNKYASVMKQDQLKAVLSQEQENIQALYNNRNSFK